MYIMVNKGRSLGAVICKVRFLQRSRERYKLGTAVEMALSEAGKYLCIPEMSGDVVCTVTKLDCQDLMHGRGTVGIVIRNVRFGLMSK